MTRRPAFWLAVAVAAGTLMIQGGDLAWSDGISMYEVARSVVEDGDVTVDRGTVWHGVDGETYSPFGIGLSVAALPLVGVIELAQGVAPIPEDMAEALVSFLMSGVAALLAVAVYRLGRRLGGAEATSVIAGAGVVAGTFMLVGLKNFSSEPLAGALIAIMVERALARRPVGAGLASAGAALARPQLFVLAPVLIWRAWADGGARAAARAAAPLAAAALLQLAYNAARFGSVWNLGYSDVDVEQGFTTPFLEGAWGLLAHPEKSIILFAPVVILVPFGLAAIRRDHPTGFWLILWTIVSTVVLAATWWDWDGGFTWGPRLLLPALPVAVATIPAWIGERRARTRGFVALLVAGLLVSIPGVLVSGGAQLADEPRPEHGPKIVRQAELLPDAVAYTVEHPYETDEGRDADRVIYLWQTGLAWRAGPAGAVAAAAGTAVLLAVTIWATVRLRRTLAQP